MESVQALRSDQRDIRVRALRAARRGTTLAEDVRAGLTAVPKQLPPKYFYDARGSKLFDHICTTPEYYPTRTEDRLLAQAAPAVIRAVRPAAIVELGSGAAHKTRHLFDACEQLGWETRYQPVDVCQEMLLESARQLSERYPWLEIEAWVGDYCLGLGHLPPGLDPRGPRLFLFLGGTIGNFYPDEAVAFLRDLRASMQPQDRLLLGADRVKDPAVLHAAYNDAQGYTAEFNLNILRVLNRALGARFDLHSFAHEAGYNAQQERIEMHLRAKVDHNVSIPALGLCIPFACGESILTEISRKFTPESLTALLRDSGFAVERHEAPPDDYFSLVLARPDS